MSTPRVPRRTWLAAVHAHRQAQWQVGHGFLRLPHRTGCPNCKARPRRKAPGKKRIAAFGNVARRHTARPKCQRSVRRCAGLWHGSGTAWTGPLVCTRRRLSRCKLVPPCDHYGKRPVRASLRGRAVQCGYCWICVAARPPATACGMEVHLGGHGVRQRLRGQNEPAEPSDDCLGASGLASGG